MEPFLLQSCIEYYRGRRGINYRIRRQWPLLKRREVEIFAEICRRLQPRRVLEWGSGFSTLQFARLLTGSFHWLAVEHDRRWHQSLAPLNHNPNVDIRLLEPNHPPVRDAQKETRYEDFYDYVDLPAKDGPFDLIIVDGRARVACLNLAKTILLPQGLVILHDAHRAPYAQAIQNWPHAAQFRDYRDKVGGIWIGSLDRPVDTVLDVAAHQRRWRLYRNPIAKALRL